MIKLLILLVLAACALFILPGALAVMAGIVLVAILAGTVLSGIGSVISFIGSTAASVLGGLFTGFLLLACAIALGVAFPVLLVALIPIGFLFLIGGFFLTLMCGVF